jgi:hypothetical protein
MLNEGNRIVWAGLFAFGLVTLYLAYDTPPQEEDSLPQWAVKIIFLFFSSALIGGSVYGIYFSRKQKAKSMSV